MSNDQLMSGITIRKFAGVLVIFLTVILACPRVSPAGDFYQSALKEGREFYRQGSYKQALERFEFAAFGLMDKPDLMRHVRGYSALTLFQLSRFDAARGELEKLSGQPNKLKMEEAGIDPRDKDFFHIMIRTLYPQGEITVTPGTRRSFEIVFQEALKSVDSGDWDAVAKKIEKLAGLISRDPRIAMLRGEWLFTAKKYAAACRQMEEALPSIQPEFRDRLLFDMVRACERSERFERVFSAHREIGDEAIKRSLQPVLDAVQSRRQREVLALARDFDRGEMKKFVALFSGDRELAMDIWDTARDQGVLAFGAMESLALDLTRFPEAVNRRFILKASKWLESKKKFRAALKILEKSPFANKYVLDNTEIMYHMGRLEGVLGENARARDLMRRIISLQPDHKAAREYLERLKGGS